MGYGTNTTSIRFTVEDIYGTDPKIPAGYVQTAFAVPKVGDLYLSKSGGTVKTMSASARAQLPKIIVTKSPKTRTLTFDVIGYNRVPFGNELGHDPRTGALIIGDDAWDTWPEILKLNK